MQRINTWMGGSEPNLIESWGPPHSTFEGSNGNKIYTWISDQGSKAVAYPIGGMMFMSAVDTSCRTSFEIEKSQKTVIKTWAEGPGCVSTKGIVTEKDENEKRQEEFQSNRNVWGTKNR
jgi:hypothetical protein